jgi:hypothetical protein
MYYVNIQQYKGPLWKCSMGYQSVHQIIPTFPKETNRISEHDGAVAKHEELDFENANF